MNYAELNPSINYNKSLPGNNSNMPKGGMGGPNNGFNNLFNINLCFP